MIKELGLSQADIGRVYNGPRDVVDPGCTVRYTMRSGYNQKLSSLTRLHLAAVIVARNTGRDAAAPTLRLTNHAGLLTTYEQQPCVVPGIEHQTCSRLTGDYMLAAQQAITTMIHEAGHTADTLTRELGYRRQTAMALAGDTRVTWDYTFVQLLGVVRRIGGAFTIS